MLLSGCNSNETGEISSYSNSISGTAGLDDVLSEYREGLYAAGVRKIIDESNIQYEV